jgi:hypothetical protein
MFCPSNFICPGPNPKVVASFEDLSTKSFAPHRPLAAAIALTSAAIRIADDALCD